MEEQPTHYYTNDAEYRQFVRNLMSMDPSKMYESEDIFVDRNDPQVSPETIDEYNVDMEAMKRYLDGVYANTKERPEFQSLYATAAALMFSVNAEIGLAVLMSYDYLALFIACYSQYMQDPASFDSSQNEAYLRLMERMKTK